MVMLVVSHESLIYHNISELVRTGGETGIPLLGYCPNIFNEQFLPFLYFILTAPH